METVPEQLDAVMDFLSKTGRGPAPTKSAEAHSWGMSCVHGSLMNMLKNIYVLGPTIMPKDRDDFVQYGLMWCSVLHTHHHEEETWYFPALNKAINVETIEKEHEKFQKPLQEMEEYLVSCLPAGAVWGIHNTKIPIGSPNGVFDAAKLNAIIDTLLPNFIPHFCDEISYLDPAKLDAFVSEAEFKAVEKIAEKEIGALPTAYVVALYLHILNPAFPPAPWFVTSILIPWVFYWKHRNIWRFVTNTPYWK
ncbi:hypothetical protein DL93DRAFT_2086374 [Clavulina sp. PMI_390]|nr:hypothetical protein DL93DRAFT_2086374 [Clavulina sp. PMI_390]